MILAALLAFAALLDGVRLLLWQYRADPALRSTPWRLALLLVAQPILAATLYAMFEPPAIGGDRATLVVLTRGAAFDLAQAGGDRVIALPGAPTLAGADRVPDLATALRRHPGVARLHIVGDGLDPRDRDAAEGRAVDFQAPSPPRGLVRIDPPGRIAPGAAFALGGAVAGVAGGTVELIDPAGRRVDVASVGPDGGYRLGGTVRAAGAALFTVRLRDSGRALVEDAAVPLIVVADPPPAVLLLAGAPGPEIKYLRRWATDAGLTLRVRSSAGGGILLGDAAEPLTAATLQRYDLVILDERSWAGLGAGERAALDQAVAGGLGLLLRVTGPLPDAVRRQWQGLGLTVAGGGETVAVAPATAAPDAEATAARRGPGTTDAASTIVAGGEPVDLARRAVIVGGDALVPLLRDARGTPLAYWRARGRGRVGLWALDDSFALVLSGRGDLHGDYWGGAIATLARPRGDPVPAIDPLARAGQRVVLCGGAARARVIAPDGTVASPVADPASGCAALWPARAGWYRLAFADPKAPPQLFYVYQADALPGVRAAETARATARLAADARTAAAHLGAISRTGPSWPWFLLWLALSTGLWWFERSRFGRSGAGTGTSSRT
jgi:hypothetical protein